MDDLLASIQEGLVVRPGDTLVLRVRPDITREQFDHFVEHAKEALAERGLGDAPVVFVAAEQLAVIRSS